MCEQVHVYAGKSILSRPEKERKIQLCISVLETLGRVDPGYTKWKGTLLQELIHPLMLISKVSFLNNVDQSIWSKGCAESTSENKKSEISNL